METRDRSFYPASPHPGHGHLTDWIANPYSIVFTGVVLFILIFGIAIFQDYRQFETTRNNALSTDKTTASLLSDLISENNKATTGILQSYAHRPLFIDAVKNKNLAGANRHLSDLKKNAEIDLTFVTDKRGILWANFPLFPEAMGKDLSSSDWYKGISSHRKPYISPVFKRIVGNKPLAVKELLQSKTELRQEEEKLRTLSSRHEAILAAAPEIIMEVDNNKVYTWANSVGIEFFGEDVIGKEASFYFEGEQDTDDTVSPFFNDTEDVIYVESWQRRKDGQKRLLAWWCRMLKNESGQITGALSSGRDITERKETENGLEKSRNKIPGIRREHHQHRA